MLSGAMTALVTPFHQGKVDEQRFRQQVEFQIQQGIDGLVPVGTTGESPTLSMAEHVRVLEIVVEASNGRVPVIGGAGANSTAEALELHGDAKRVGCRACLSVNPYYNKPSQEGLYRHFMTLADRVDLHIVLYNIPSRTGITMSPATVARLAEHPNIIAVKEATGSLDIATEIRSLCDLPVISGDDSLTLPIMSIGGTGVISVLSNLLPRQVKQLVTHVYQGNIHQAQLLHVKLFPLIKALFVEGNPVGIKAAMQIAGTDTGEIRQPLWPASQATRQLLENEMQKIGAPLMV